LYLSSLEVFCAFINNTGNYKNDDVGILYNSRIDNVPVLVDTWDDNKKYVKARNFFILAPTGFGKSFNANHIISSYLAQGVKVVIVDLGGSYRKLASLFPNQTAYVSYKQGVSMGVNPFELDNNFKEKKGRLNNDKIDELVEFIGVHFKRDSELSEIERASLRKLIEVYYKNTEIQHSLPDFVLFVKNTPDLLEELEIKEAFFNKAEFLHLMSEFVDGGIYDYLYKEKGNSVGDSLKGKDIVVFELDKVKDNALLLSIMLQMVSTTIDKVIWQDKRNKGIVLFDEIAEQLKWHGVLGRVQYFFQAIRKQEGAIGIILQSESQLPDNNLSKAIIENTQILYVLGAKDYRSLQKRFDLSEHCYYQMCSIQSDFNAERPFSELLILRENTHQVYRLEVSKEVYWAYQTAGAQNQQLLDKYKEVGNMEKAIKQFLLTV
jgi:type IV secretory pathway VirB4 component